ncbi:hypothetical protein C8R45DRAFT_1096944 [Mycena sanguinolenta]|nr:hypothetical protein C8R45DRAFT_1096944 [Mycena sanguinolenta]
MLTDQHAQSRPGSAHSHDPHTPPLAGPTYHDLGPSYAYNEHVTLPLPHFAHATLPPLIPTHSHPAHGHTIDLPGTLRKHTTRANLCLSPRTPTLHATIMSSTAASARIARV